jgi:hypothetical protein
MARPEPLACPTCKRPVLVEDQEGGRGSGDLTTYCVVCECGLAVYHLGNDGTRANGTREWNRWVREQLGLPQRGANKALSTHVPIPQPIALRSYSAVGKQVNLPISILAVDLERRTKRLVDSDPDDMQAAIKEFLTAAANLALAAENAAVVRGQQ